MHYFLQLNSLKKQPLNSIKEPKTASAHYCLLGVLVLFGGCWAEYICEVWSCGIPNFKRLQLVCN